MKNIKWDIAQSMKYSFTCFIPLFFFFTHLCITIKEAIVPHSSLIEFTMARLFSSHFLKTTHGNLFYMYRYSFFLHKISSQSLSNENDQSINDNIFVGSLGSDTPLIPFFLSIPLIFFVFLPRFVISKRFWSNFISGHALPLILIQSKKQVHKVSKIIIIV